MFTDAVYSNYNSLSPYDISQMDVSDPNSLPTTLPQQVLLRSGQSCSNIAEYQVLRSGTNNQNPSAQERNSQDKIVVETDLLSRGCSLAAEMLTTGKLADMR